jgi:hypothetical protein
MHQHFTHFFRKISSPSEKLPMAIFNSDLTARPHGRKYGGFHA